MKHFRPVRVLKRPRDIPYPRLPVYARDETHHLWSSCVPPSLPARAVMIRNEVFSCFLFYAVLLIVKMYVIAIITGQVRLRKKAFANPEDALRHGGLQFHREDPYVERCRRAHINDMENILPFLFLGAIYSLTGPSLFVARLHFLVFSLSRLLHTVAYLLALRAPTRSVAYTIAQIPCVSMAVQILMSVMAYA
ncbi:hypothetical protein OJAV_G00122270 [Oryzias javanicus]|uniref:Prostaglandin E synthase n=1 Tax=Oryzias javanicus TaxID=123683 RepID=A0A3S2MSR9_ORYJA|nr:hypothetical protein OJAV_G00122270 [Oryzias javanicus]